MKKTTKPRAYVKLTAYWGNGDAESTIKISPKRWKQIQEGAEDQSSAWGYYEGSRFSVYWRFTGGKVSINGDDGMECVLSLPVSDLIVQTPPSNLTAVQNFAVPPSAQSESEMEKQSSFLEYNDQYGDGFSASLMDGPSIDLFQVAGLECTDELWAAVWDTFNWQSLLTECGSATIIEIGDQDEMPGMSDIFYWVAVDNPEEFRCELREVMLSSIQHPICSGNKSHKAAHSVLSTIYQENTSDLDSLSKAVREAVIELVSSAGTGSGSFSEQLALPSGQSITNRFSHSDGLRWLAKSKEYRSAFGEPPTWLKYLTPSRRTRICGLALELGLALPAQTPKEFY